MPSFRNAVELVIKFKEQGSIMDSIAKLVGYVCLFFFVVGAYEEWKKENGNGASSKSKAICKIVHVSQNEDTYYLKDDFDFGYTVNTKIQNIGERGHIDILATLSTSEGVFKREQNVLFEKGQIFTLAYQFNEPTINATSIQGRINCAPNQ